jgi:hypothetical protein
MKKGKTSQIDGFDNAKIIYGTVDSVNLKSIYLNIQTWVEPILELEDWNRVVLNLSRDVKHSIYETMNQEVFNNTFIVDLDLRSSGLSQLKKSFMNLEINFYLNQENLEFKDDSIKNTLHKITSEIFNRNFNKNKYFNFYLTKTTKIYDDEVELQSS